jgi:hypothetical protein
VTELFDVGPEESVLGAILNAASFSKDAGHKVCDRVVETGLLPEMFYVRSYGALFHALVVQRHRLGIRKWVPDPQGLLAAPRVRYQGVRQPGACRARASGRLTVILCSARVVPGAANERRPCDHDKHRV